MCKGKLKRVLSKGFAAALSLTLVLGMGVLAYADEDDEPYAPDEDVPIGWIDDDYDAEGYICLSCSTSDLNVGDTASAHADVWTNREGTCWIQVEWESNSPNVATVEGSGNDVTIRANGSGTAYISATLKIGGQWFDSDGFYVNVSDPQPQYISVNGIGADNTSMTLDAGGYSRFNVWVTPSNANNQGISFSSNNDSVAWVDSDGDVHANSEGSCVITARTNENGYCAYCNVTVNGTVYNDLPVTSVSVDPSSATMVVNQTMTINPTVYPLGTSNTQVLWDSTNPMVAVVDAYGNVTAKSVGTTNINCTTVNGNRKSFAVINVVADTPNNNAQGTVVASKSRSVDFNYKVCTEILNAKKNATVTINSPTPMSYDKTVATLLASRPDIKLACTFTFNGHIFTMTLPKKYDLSKQLDKTGYVEWLDLCTKKGVDVKIK